MGTGWRVLLLAGRREALWLARSPLVLAGLAISAWLIWLNNHVHSSPYAYPQAQVMVWWSADVSIVTCLLAAAGALLIAGQLAAGRARRDGMEQLYESYPAPAALRSGALLLGAVGPVLLAAVLTGAAVALVDGQHALGAPRLWVLSAGLLLIVLAGTMGTALGSWLRHPMAGILVVLVLGLIEIDLALSFTNPIHLPGGVAWLFPWSDPGDLLNSLPGLIVPYPPPAHLAELAGLIALAAVAALWPVVARRRLAAGLAVAALAVTCWSGWLEARPVATSVLSAMARQVTRPAQSERCRLVHGVRYCFYPAFAPLAATWAAPVDGVLARLPRYPRPRLIVRQVWSTNFLMPPLLSPAGLTSNAPPPPTQLSRQVDTFVLALSTDPQLIPGSSVPPVFTDQTQGTGSGVGAAQFALALSTAEWATGLPTTGRVVFYSNSYGSGTPVLACVPVGQARQSIALWLAAGATAATRAAFPHAGIAGVTQVGRQWISTVQEPGAGPSVGLVATAQGAALAAEMLRLPDRQVKAVLGPRWQSWLQPRATTAELAAALGLRLPRQPAARPQLPNQPYTRGNVSYAGNYTPPSPLCS